MKLNLTTKADLVGLSNAIREGTYNVETSEIIGAMNETLVIHLRLEEEESLGVMYLVDLCSSFDAEITQISAPQAGLLEVQIETKEESEW